MKDEIGLYKTVRKYPKSQSLTKKYNLNLKIKPKTEKNLESLNLF